MDSLPTHTGQRIETASRWLAVIDSVFAVCAAVFAAPMPWLLEPHGVGFTASLFILLVAVAFIIASIALKRGWRGRWLIQIVGPALTFYLLFGLAWALSVSIIAAIVGGLALHWAVHHDS